MSFTFVNGGELRLRETGGLQWDEGNHYLILVKNAHVPLLTHTTFGDLTNLCDSANYAHQQLTGKAFNSGNCDFDDPDFTSGGANVMVARYVFLIEGTAGSPQAGDRIIGYWDLNVANQIDVNIDQAMNLPTGGFLEYLTT